MSRICANCHKTPVIGSSKKHRRGVAGKRWKNRVPATPRLFMPNLQKFEGQLLCTKCIKRKKLNASTQALQA